MMKSLLYKFCFLVVALFQFATGIAQQPAFKSVLPVITTDSFYRINIDPLIVAKCKPGLADMRIKDKEGKIIPYYLLPQQPVFKESSFVEFPIIKNAREADKLTHVVMQNPTGKMVNELILEVKNTDAGRSVTVSGSDDNAKFYVIAENIYLQNVNGESGKSMQAISFSPSKYKYFQVTILGKDLLPINITRAGVSTENFISGKYEKLPKAVIIQKDSSNKKSYVTLISKEPFQVDKIDLEISGAKFYKRPIEISDGLNNNARPFNFILSPESSGSLPVTFKTFKLFIIIDNEDNPPLQIVGANLWQLSASVIAYLEKDKEYSIYFGDANAEAPVYDIGNVAETAAGKAIHISSGKIEKLTSENIVVEKASYFSQTTLWIIIIAALLVLLFVTYSLTRQVKERKDNI